MFIGKWQHCSKKEKRLDDIIDFHKRFEAIHPFQDGNGRVGRLEMFKECLSNGIVPFIITDDLKLFYYRGLQNWPRIPASRCSHSLQQQSSSPHGRQEGLRLEDEIPLETDDCKFLTVTVLVQME